MEFLIVIPVVVIAALLWLLREAKAEAKSYRAMFDATRKHRDLAADALMAVEAELRHTRADYEKAQAEHRRVLEDQTRVFEDPPSVVPNCVWPDHEGRYRAEDNTRRCRDEDCSGYISEVEFPYSLVSPRPYVKGYLTGLHEHKRERAEI